MQRAAVRKLAHELGIPAAQLPLSGFHFLTRLHYCAADTGTYGPDAEWGEHEVRACRCPASMLIAVVWVYVLTCRAQA